MLTPISPKNFELLEDNVDDLAAMVNHFFQERNLPFELMQFRVCEIDAPASSDIEAAWETQFVPDGAQRISFDRFAENFAPLRERFSDLNDVHCSNGVLRYRCDPKTGACVPICRP
ncbi:hypothetical protein [Fibrivirga algicola]|uniref:Uncharacterized protein n=1 Tax=Fibrivirga algicola TaxID=2950420 RepID=A0ABX0QRK2_9BACT|nr:hypothetical protein [Fibrivirga algicola]NID13502.1 hypothetical protein [Fibrivirga algicola]